MKIVVIGGGGLIGTRLVRNLRQRAHEVVAASPASGVNTLTGEGLSEALEGALVVVDVSNSPSFRNGEVAAFFETSGRNLVAAATAAGVRHHVALSIVGAERLVASGYFRGKVAQEEIIVRSGLPYTIVRSTQFFEFVHRIADSATHDQTVRVPPVFVRPVAADDVAESLALVALGEPVNGIIELAGPELMRLDELVRRVLAALNDPRQVTADAHAPYFGSVVDDQSLTPGEGADGGAISLDSWLHRTIAET